MVSSLQRYDVACQALAKALSQAKSVPEVRKITAEADALRAYAKQAKNKGLETDAAEIRFRAERRVGELIQVQKATVGLAKPPGKKIGVNSTPISISLREAGIDKNLAKRARTLVAIRASRFEELIREWRERIQAETERVTLNLLREGERAQKRRHAPALPAGLFRLLYADPPWQYEHVKTESRAIENQYPTMTLDEICALQVPAAENAVLFLWATSPKVREAMRVIEAWEFTYRTCAVWDKVIIGMGYYFRQQHELLLVAAKGDPPVPTTGVRVSSVIRIKRGPHSRKPDHIYELLESMYPTFTDLDRVELFSRRSRAGWSAWGNEAATTEAVS